MYIYCNDKYQNFDVIFGSHKHNILQKRGAVTFAKSN